MERYFIEQHHRYNNGGKKPILDKLNIIDRTTNGKILMVNLYEKNALDIIQVVDICDKLNNEDQAYREVVNDFLCF